MESNYIKYIFKNWCVTYEVSCSNHMHIKYEVTEIRPQVKIYRNPRRTNQEKYYKDLENGDLKEAIISAYYWLRK